MLSRGWFALFLGRYLQIVTPKCVMFCSRIEFVHDYIDVHYTC